MSDASRQIDEHIAALKDWRGDFMSQLRRLINKADPSLEEDWKWGTPMWTSNGNVCAIGAFKETVKLNFFRGAGLPDPHHLFNAGLEAKTSRSIDFKQGERIQSQPLTELIRAAVAANKR